MKKEYCEHCNEYTEHKDLGIKVMNLLECQVCGTMTDPKRKRYVITGPETAEETVKAKKELLIKDPEAIIIPEDVALRHKMEGWKKFPTIGEKKIQRNDPCPCGSGKKYKKCCIDK